MSDVSKHLSSLSKAEAGARVSRFSTLLKGYAAATSRASDADVSQLHRIRTVLEEFRQVHHHSEASEQVQAASEQKRMAALLVGYREAEARYRQRQAKDADDFNILGVFQLTGKEIRHSMVLAWLLDHDLRKLGTHAQGNLGFRLFLQRARLPLHYAECANYWVRREVGGDESIVDIEVACRGQFLIHIENKIWSGEGNDQTNREWADLVRRADALQVKLDAVHALFLTPYGVKPSNYNFRPISWWRHIMPVLEEFAAKAKPRDVRLFAEHYARILWQFILTEDPTEDDHGQRADE